MSLSILESLRHKLPIAHGLTLMTPRLRGWEAFSTPGALTHTSITWALSPMAPQVPGVTPRSPLCPWCCGHSSWKGARQLHTREWEPMTNILQALSLVEKAEPVQVCFTLRLRDQLSMWMQDGCKVCMVSYMASHRSCFMVTWIIYKNHLLEGGLTQNEETMAHWTLTTADLLYLSCVRTCMSRNSLK